MFGSFIHILPKLCSNLKNVIHTEEHNKYLPYYFIIKEDDSYYPIMMKEKENINYVTCDEIYNISEMLPQFDEFKIRVSNSKNIND